IRAWRTRRLRELASPLLAQRAHRMKVRPGEVCRPGSRSGEVLDPPFNARAAKAHESGDIALLRRREHHADRRHVAPGDPTTAQHDVNQRAARAAVAVIEGMN